MSRAAGSHRVDLPGTPWKVWSWVVLRGAGFPVGELEGLTDGALEQVVNDLAEAEEHARACALTELRRSARGAGGSKQQRLVRALRRISAGGDPTQDALVNPLVADAMGDAWPRLREARRRYDLEYVAARERVRRVIAARPSDARFAAAVTWQNRAVFRSSLSPLAPAPGAPFRRAELLVASYLQRYTCKNDSIGFFGPIGWGELGGDGWIDFRPDRDLVRSRQVHLEEWVIDTLAKALSSREGMRPHLNPRLFPFFRLEGRVLHVPMQDPVDLGETQAAALTLCDGTRSANEIIRTIGEDSRDEVLGSLSMAADMGVIAWQLEVPRELDSGHRLRALLEKIGDPALRDESMACLRRLEAAREEVEAAGDDPVALDQAIGALEAEFTQLTGAVPTRHGGRTYGARTTCYLDCRRGVSLRLGDAWLERLARPLDLVLTSVRWASAEATRLYVGRIGALCRDVGNERGESLFDLVHLFHRLMNDPALSGERSVPAPIVEALGEQRRRWSEILAPHVKGLGPVQLSSADLAPAVQAAFAAPGGPGFSLARHVSPDVLIAADGPEAIARGEFDLVLGEVHLGNTVMVSALASVHDDPDAMVRAKADDLGPTVMPVLPKDTGGQRTNVMPCPSDWRFEFLEDPPPGPRERALRLADLQIDLRGPEPIVRSREAELTFSLAEFVGFLIRSSTANIGDISLAGAHSPRVTIDGLTVARERWRVAASEIPLAGTEAERYLGIRRWARTVGIPRRCFVKVPVEDKPFLLDLESPPLLEVFARAVRRTSVGEGASREIQLTEMMPTPERSWLSDSSGRRYTSELRMVLLDTSGGPDALQE